MNIVFPYFASFTGYEDDIFEVISNMHVQGSKFGGKFDKFGGKHFQIRLRGVHGVRIFQVCSLNCSHTCTNTPSTVYSPPTLGWSEIKFYKNSKFPV